MSAVPHTESNVGTIPKVALNADEAARALGVSKVSIYRLISCGRLRAVQCLRHKVVPVAELHAFLARETKPV